MAIDVNIPSQVKNYANLAAFPATGTLKTIFIAEDTNKTYRWTGSAYVEISATAASTWGAIGGTLSNQTDLQNALNAKVTSNTAITGATKTKVTYDSKGLVTAGADATTADIADSLNKRYVTDANLTTIGNTSGTNTGDNATNSQYSGLATSKQDTLVSATNIKTINGTTLLGSGDITVGGGVTIGTTAITSGTVGRVLFEGTGNVVQESANLSWDNTNAKLLINGGFIIGADFVATSSAFKISGTDATIGIRSTSSSGFCGMNMYDNANNNIGSFQIGGTATGSPFAGNMFIGARQATGRLLFVRGVSATQSMTMFSTGNLLIQDGGTHTDAGYKLDVNGTLRSSSGISLINDSYFGDTLGPRIRVSGGAGLISCVYNSLGLSGGQSVSIGNNTFSIGTGGATNGTLTITTPAKVANTSETINLISSNMYYGAGEGRLVLQGASSIYSGSIGNLYLAGGRNSGGGNNGNTYLAYDLTGALGSVGIGTNSINTSAITQIDSTTKGFLPPRMTTTQKNAIASPATGLMVYDTTLNLMALYNGTVWTTL